jgi:hypothetical protein
VPALHVPTTAHACETGVKTVHTVRTFAVRSYRTGANSHTRFSLNHPCLRTSSEGARTAAHNRQAGGHWFEPSTAHQSTRWKRRAFSCSEAWTASSSPLSQNGHARPVDAAGYAGSTVKIARRSCSRSSTCGKSSFATTRKCSPRPSRNIGGNRRTPSVVDSVRASGWVHCPFV